MNWGSLLGAIAAPFTGGLSVPIGAAVDAVTGGSKAPQPTGSVLGNVSQVAGADAAAAAKGQATQAGIQQTQDQLALQRNKQQQQQILDAIAAQRNAITDANTQTNQGSAQAIRGGLLQGLQDTHITAPEGVHMGTVTGGLRPSAITGAADIGKSLQARGMNELNNPTVVTPYSAVPVPGLTPLPTPSTTQSILSGIGTYGSLASAVADGLNGLNKNTSAPPVSQTDPGLYGSATWNAPKTGGFSFGAPLTATPAPMAPAPLDWTAMLAPKPVAPIQFGGRG